MASPVVFADANILYSAALRDLLMQLAVDGAITLRWSDKISVEWITAVLRTRPHLTERLQRTQALMNRQLPDAVVAGYEPLIASLSLPDADDRHVLAAAMHGDADILLTFNLDDFPASAERHRPVAVHPDTFLTQLGATAPSLIHGAVAAILDRLTSPHVSNEAYCAALTRAGLPATAELVARLFRTD